MKKHHLIIIAVTLLATMASCNRDHKPDNLIDTATMTAIMTEYYLIEGYDYVVASRNQDSLGYQSHAAKDSLLKKHNISQSDYDSSLAYYIRHPKVFEAMMDRAINALESKIKPIN